MARKAEIWRVASSGLLACLAAALIPLALSALASLSLDRAAHTAPLTTWAHSPLWARWLTAVTSPATLILSLLLIAIIVAWWVWISGHLMRPRTSGNGVVAGIPRTAGRGEHGTSNLMAPAALVTSAVTWSPGTTPVPGVSGFVIGATPAERGRKETYYLSGSEGHVLVIGSTGSGKTRRIVLPSIYALSELGESMVIPDPKGELYLTICERLEAKGYRVDTIDLRDPSRSVQWSPLDLIVDGHLLLVRSPHPESRGRQYRRPVQWRFGCGGSSIGQQIGRQSRAAVVELLARAKRDLPARREVADPQSHRRAATLCPRDNERRAHSSGTIGKPPRMSGVIKSAPTGWQSATRGRRRMEPQE